MPLDISRIQALCFDVDGTLRDTDDQMVLRFSRRLQPVRFLFPGRDQGDAFEGNAAGLVQQLPEGDRVFFPLIGGIKPGEIFR